MVAGVKKRADVLHLQGEVCNGGRGFLGFSLVLNQTEPWGNLGLIAAFTTAQTN